MDLGITWLRKRPAPWMLLLGIVGVGVIDLLDYATPADVKFAALYLLPIIGSAWFGGRRVGIAVAVIGALSRLGLELFVYPPVPHPWVPYLNMVILCGAFSVVAVLSSSVRELLARSEERVAQRTAELERQVTERKHAEAELRASEERFRQLTDNIKGVFWMTNVKKTEMIYISPGYETIWGRTCQSLYDSPRAWLEAIDPEDLERVTAAAMKQEEGRYDVQYRIVRPDGSRRWIRDRAFPVYDGNGNIYRIAGVADDITSQKEAEQALSKSELQLRLVWENSLDGMRLMDGEGTFIAVNDAYSRLVGLPRERLIDKPLAVIFPEARREHVLRRHRERFRNRSVPPHSEEELQLWDGRKLSVEMSSSFVEGPGGPVLLLSIFRDISGVIEQRRLEKQLLEISDREQARIGHDLHDDLCQFLVGVLFHCEDLAENLLRAGRSEAAQARKVAGLIDSAISQAHQLARGLFPVLLEQEGLVPALQEFALSVKGRLKIECAVQCHGEVRIGKKVVANHLYRIAQEAVSNAGRHGHATRITIDLDATDSFLKLAVTDNGAGLPERLLPQGMGLHIMNYRAHSIGGTLEVKPQLKGGTTVTCRIPVENL